MDLHQVPTRGLVAGGADPGKLNSIEYVTIPSKGNALDFGDLSNNIDQTEGNSNGVRGIFGGGGRTSKLLQHN